MNQKVMASGPLLFRDMDGRGRMYRMLEQQHTDGLSSSLENVVAQVEAIGEH